jgi:hypothetical protein
MEKSTDNASEEKHRPGFLAFVFWPAAGLLIYVLSFGPVVRFVGDPSPELRTFYKPLGWAHDHLPPFQKAFDAYMSLWDKHW